MHQVADDEEPPSGLERIVMFSDAVIVIAITRFDRPLIWLNLLFLMAIGFVPFASAVHSEHPGAAAAGFYDATMVLVALLSAAVWGYAIAGDRLVSPGLDPRIRRQSLVSPLLVAGVFALSGVIAQIDLHLGRWVLLLLIPAAWGGAGRHKGDGSTAAS